jgi:hypothetical protein
MRAINVLLSILVSVAIAFLVFEGGLRLLPAFRPQPTINQFDAGTGWAKKPGVKVTRNVAGRGIEFAINAHGLREDEGVGPARTPRTARILALGDSFVLGYTVDKDASFVERLEQRFRSEQRAVEVVNAGTEGWSVDQSVVWFAERGREFAPDIVLLFPFENDIYWCGQERYTRFDKPRFGSNGVLERRELADPGPAPAISNLALGKFLGFALGALGSRPAPGEFVVEGANLRLPGEFAPLLKSPPPFVADAEARMESALHALKKLCDGLQVPLLVVPIPSKSAIHADEREFFRTWKQGLKGLADDAWSPDRPVDVFLAAAQRQGIEVLDPRETLRREGAARKLYFEGALEWHLNDNGNLAFANYLHDQLAKRPELAIGGPAPATPSAPFAYTDAPAPSTDWRFVGGLFAGLWIVLTAIFIGTYPDENKALAPLKVGGMLALVFTIFLGGRRLLGFIPAAWSGWILGAFVLGVLGFVAYKLGRRLATIAELLASFVQRGHWYLMPLLVVLLSIGSLLVVAASSPLIAPFIYTLF